MHLLDSIYLRNSLPQLPNNPNQLYVYHPSQTTLISTNPTSTLSTNLPALRTPLPSLPRFACLPTSSPVVTKAYFINQWDIDTKVFSRAASSPHCWSLLFSGAAVLNQGRTFLPFFFSSLCFLRWAFIYRFESGQLSCDDLCRDGVVTKCYGSSNQDLQDGINVSGCTERCSGRFGC